ncbi:hypothetical protein LTR10_014986 [Elasticomyces elasticus]|nr:hypothetical protein LTR10_014986 [Elasticomyces elasticus]KAK4964564.1 hypothetical protein LTR42_012860 [Elasticomyces elasticus]
MPVERVVAASTDVPSPILRLARMEDHGHGSVEQHLGKGQDATAGNPLQISSSFCPAGAASHPERSAKKQVFWASSAPLTAELYFCTPQRFSARVMAFHKSSLVAKMLEMMADVEIEAGCAFLAWVRPCFVWLVVHTSTMPWSVQRHLEGLQERPPKYHQPAGRQQKTPAVKVDST